MISGLDHVVILVEEIGKGTAAYQTLLGRMPSWRYSSDGADRVLFASDCPFDKEKGPGYIRDTIKVLESLPLANAEREKISWRNAVKLFGLAS